MKRALAYSALAPDWRAASHQMTLTAEARLAIGCTI
jgi:hypothetical protein